MWRRRSLAGALGPIVAMLIGQANSRRLLRLVVLALIFTVTMLGVRGSVTAAGRPAAASLGVVQSFGGALTMARIHLNVSPGAPTRTGDLLVAVVEVRNVTSPATVAGVTDSGGNSWVKATAVHYQAIDEEMWYAVDATGISSSGSVGVRASSASAIAMTVIELGGVRTSAPLDVMSTNSGSSTTPSTGTTATTNDAHEIAVAAIGWNSRLTPSGQTAGYAPIPAAQSSVSGEPVGEQAGVQVLSAIGTQHYAATLSASVHWTGIVATFEAASAPPTPTPTATATPTISPTPTPSGSPIKHVVVIYQENHSFDETLGNWCFTTSRCNGYDVTQPVVLKGGVQITMQKSPDVVPQVSHSVASQVTAMDGGLMDGWAGVPGCGATSTISGAIPYGCLTYYTPPQIPNLISLATKFAVSDRTFSMADSPSWGGHLYAVAATNDNFTGENPVPPNPTPSGWTLGPGWGCDSNKVTVWINPTTGATSLQPSCIPDSALGLPNGGAFKPTSAQYVPTIMDRLDQAGLSWRLYTDSTTDSGYIWAVCPSFAECLYSNQSKNMVPVQQVLTDAAGGTLPAYSLVLDGAGTYGAVVQHNGMSMATGDNWIGQVVSAIENGPNWSSTAIFITYDDCGCFYDHVPPAVNPDGTQQGVRVPMVIVSPYAKAGYTDSSPATFASILAFVEQTFSLTSLGVNDAGAYAYADAFNYSQAPLGGVPMRQQKVPLAEQQYIAAHPGDPDDPT
jgi:phospholipase C